MKILISILAVLFGGLHFVAGFTQLKAKDRAARSLATAMTCGGICAAAIAVAHLAGGSPDWMDAPILAVGCLLICAAAWENGRRSGNFHLSHHIVRGVIAVLLVIGFLIW